MHHLLLASTSPRRRDLLGQLGIPFAQVDPGVDERAPYGGEDPAQYVTELAVAKARSVSSRFPSAVVLGSDTTVSVGGAILGKPITAEDAVTMLRRLAGRTHSVLTGVAVAEAGRCDVETVETFVTMHPPDEHAIREYVRTGEPMDKAGAYGLQGLGSRFVVQISGCRTSVIGLPLCCTSHLLRASGMRPAGSKWCDFCPEREFCS